MSGRDNRRHCCCCCCCLLLWKRSPNNIILLLLLKMQPGMNFNVNSNLDFRFCLTGIQILSLRFCKYRFVYDLNRYFWETFTLFLNCRHETNFLTKEFIQNSERNDERINHEKWRQEIPYFLSGAEYKCRIQTRPVYGIPTHVRPFDKITFHSEYKSLKSTSTRGTHTKNR